MSSIYDDLEAIARQVQEGKHRELVGGLWDELGRLQLDFLVSRGLEPHHRLLDLGCGCLRGGVPLIDYLESGNYFGIDVNQPLLDAGRREVAAAGLEHKLPPGNLVCTGSFDLSAFQELFDFALAQSLFTHLPLNPIRACLERLPAAMKPGGRLYATYFERARPWPEGHEIQHPGGVTTYSDADPYHYTVADFAHLCRDLPWVLEPVGEWNHPRDQKMLAFVFEPPAAGATHGSGPARASRTLNVEEAARLQAGDDHYRAFVGPPDRFDFMSGTQFDLLFALGLREDHKVLDFGCGSLRAGRLLIPYLLRGHYFGIEPNSWLVEDGLRHETGYDLLEAKSPRFSSNSDFDCSVFGETFDFILAQSILTHCGVDLARRALRGFASALAPSGKVVLSFIEAAEGCPESTADGWHYPDCVAYRRETIDRFAAEAGLVGRALPWYHPAASWYVAARTEAALPPHRHLRHLTGATLDPRHAASLSRRAPDHGERNPLAEAAVATPIAGASLGRLRLESPARAVASSYQELRFVYEGGERGIAAGGAVRIALGHVCPWSPPQGEDPSLPGYVTATLDNGGRVSISGWSDSRDARDRFLETFPWQYVIQVEILDRPLAPGERLAVTYGDRAAGGAGTRTQMFEERAVGFLCSVDPDGSRRFITLPDKPVLEIAGGDTARLVAIGPSDVELGEPLRLIVRAEDRYGNRSAEYRSRVTVREGGPDGRVVGHHDFTAADRGIAHLTGVRLSTPGCHTLWVGDGTLSARSNPIRIRTADQQSPRVYWGELHGHTEISDGRGSLESYYDYAESISGLQVCAVTDHDFLIGDAAWALSKRITNERNVPGQFVTLQAYEWSGTTEVGGDRNVYFRGSDPPLIRSRSYYDYRNPHAYHGTRPAANHIEDLFHRLLADPGPEEVLVVPHFGGRPANPRWHRPELEPLIEVFSEHQRSEHWVAGFTARGYRLGMVAGGDDHIGRPGYGFLPASSEDAGVPESGHGLIAIMARELSREAVFDALRERRVYATTGDRILLEVEVNGRPMGSELAAAGSIEVAVTVHADGALDNVQVLRDGETVHEFLPPDRGTFDESGYLAAYPDIAEAVRRGQFPDAETHYERHGRDEGRRRFQKVVGQGPRAASFRWSDPPLEPGRTAAYVVRVVQANGGLAISSPVWVTGSGD